MRPIPDAPADVIARHAARFGGKVAVRDSRTALTYAELDGAVRAAAASFYGAGVRRGVPVLTFFDVCVESVVAYWALRSLGATVVVGDPGATEADVAYYKAKTTAAFVLAGERAKARRAVASSEALFMLEDGTSGLRDWRSQAPPESLPAMRETDHAVVLFSSGTTGRPKAIVHTADSVTALHDSLKDTWGLCPSDIVLGALPFHTIYGLLFSAGSAINAGAALVLLERFRPDQALAAIERHHVTTAALVPAMALMMLTVQDGRRFDLSSLRMVYSASAPISEADLERFATFSGRPILTNYGMTEIPGAAVERYDRPHRPGAVGRISPGFEAVAVGPGGAPLPPGETGEIKLSGPSMMQAYLGDPEQTAERIRDGWIMTQDIGRVDADGNIFLSGRMSDLIIRGGLNISPIEVENAISRHDAVRDVAVVGATDPILGQRVVAFVAAATSAEALKAHCQELLSPAKVPAAFYFRDALPRNDGGKVLRRELAAEADRLIEGEGEA